MDLDLIIRNGRIIDGTGNPWFHADIGIKNSKIQKIGRLIGVSATTEIDAAGLTVSPGFIDIHAHSDFTLLVNPHADSFVTQGVTTQVIGNCGYSCAPIKDETREISTRYILGYQPDAGIDIDWYTFGEYLERLKTSGLAQNVIPLVGHGNIRVAVMGLDVRTPTDSELEEMEQLTEDALNDGAFGLSSGLEYAPGINSETHELIALCNVVSRCGGIYVSHLRERGEDLEASVNEAIEIGIKAKIPVHISHNWPKWPYANKGEYARNSVREARKRRFDVTFDAHIWKWACTLLIALLPSWAVEGGVEKLLERLNDSVLREKMGKKRKEPDFWPLVTEGKWDKLRLGYAAKSPEFIGKSFDEIAIAKNIDPWDAVFEILLTERDGAYNAIVYAESNVDVHATCIDPLCALGSDGMSLSQEGILKKVMFHPRSYGNAPRVLREYVREKKLLTMEEAVRKMSSLPAQRFGLFDRSLLRKGMWADITMFNPETIREKATLADHNQYSEGVEYVLINGMTVLAEGKSTGALPGNVLSPQ